MVATRLAAVAAAAFGDGAALLAAGESRHRAQTNSRLIYMLTWALTVQSVPLRSCLNLRMFDLISHVYCALLLAGVAPGVQSLTSDRNTCLGGLGGWLWGRLGRPLHTATSKTTCLTGLCG